MYIKIGVDGVKYYAHRLAWLYIHGSFPVCCIDHISGDGTDNRMSNLREASYQENSKNMARQSKSKSGVTGVIYSKWHDKWIARITDNKIQKYLGSYNDKQDAIKARLDAERDMGFHNNHGRRPSHDNRPTNRT